MRTIWYYGKYFLAGLFLGWALITAIGYVKADTICTPFGDGISCTEVPNPPTRPDRICRPFGDGFICT